MDNSGTDRWLAAVMHCSSPCITLILHSKGSSSLRQMTMAHQYLLV